jgi:hypothetical protein
LSSRPSLKSEPSAGAAAARRGRGSWALAGRAAGYGQRRCPLRRTSSVRHEKTRYEHRPIVTCQSDFREVEGLYRRVRRLGSQGQQRDGQGQQSSHLASDNRQPREHRRREGSREHGNLVAPGDAGCGTTNEDSYFWQPNRRPLWPWIATVCTQALPLLRSVTWSQLGKLRCGRRSYSLWRQPQYACM